MFKLCKGADIIMKKIVSIIIAAALVLSLACLVACGGKEAERNESKISDALTTDGSILDDDLTDDLTDELTTDADESMSGNVDDDNDGVIESNDSESTSENATTTAAR